MKLIVIFPGWGTTESLYQKIDLQGYEVLVVDSFDEEDLVQEIRRENPTEINFLGWSLGSILAFKYLKSFEVNKLILLAPTLYFLEDQPKIVVKKMIRDLKRNQFKMLVNFSRLNFYNKNSYQDYLVEYKNELQKLDQDYLEDGLKFLLEEDLREMDVVKGITPLIVIGKEDQIINNTSSKQVLDYFKDYSVHTLEGVGHNLLYEAEDRINNLIRGYLND